MFKTPFNMTDGTRPCKYAAQYLGFTDAPENFTKVYRQGVPYAVVNGHTNKLGRLWESDYKTQYMLTTGDMLSLPWNYTIEAKQVDSAGQKAWLEFGRQGEYCDDNIIDVGTCWVSHLDDVLNEDDVVVLVICLESIFETAIDFAAVLRCLWLMDYENAFEV